MRFNCTNPTNQTTSYLYLKSVVHGSMSGNDQPNFLNTLILCHTQIVLLN